MAATGKMCARPYKPGRFNHVLVNLPRICHASATPTAATTYMTFCSEVKVSPAVASAMATIVARRC